MLVQPLSRGECDTTCTAALTAEKFEEGEEKEPNFTPELTTLTLDLACYVIANYFKLLVKWGTDMEVSRTTSVDNADGDTDLCNFSPQSG